MLVMGLPLLLLGGGALHAGEQPHKGGNILWAVHESMPDFDTHYESSYIAAQPIGPIYNGLVTQDVYDNGRIIGDLAERWEISADGKRITFFLHKGVKFHDGSDFSCADAQYSLDKLADRNRANPAFVGVLEPVYDNSSCADDFTLVLSPEPALGSNHDAAVRGTRRDDEEGDCRGGGPQGLQVFDRHRSV
jgi:peptide/nickel transport system substrate-binding protein